MHKIPNWLINFSLLAVTVLLFFGTIEGLVRITGIVKMKDYTPPIYEKNENPEISYTLKPNIREKAFRNLVTTDENGFRSNGSSSGMTNPESPIVILGDSITFGYGVKDAETLPAQIQILLPQHTVINAGTPGYNIGQEVAFFVDKIAPLDPEMLVLVFYWNDFDQKTSWLDDEGIMRAKEWIPQKKQCTPIERGILGLILGRCWFDLHSAFYKGVKEYVNTRMAIKERDSRRQEAQINAQLDLQDGHTFDTDLLSYKITLRALANAAPKRRLFVIWPDAELHEEMRPNLVRIAQEQGFDVLDLYDHFGNTMETLSWDYMHPSVESLQEAAATIADILTPLFSR